jgi:hypothetical protein
MLLERLEVLADRLRRKEQVAPVALEEETIRLLAGMVALLRQHRINKRGQCKYCGWTRWGWRLWRRRPKCTVYMSFDFAMRQPLDIVRRLLEDHQT